MPQPPWRPTTLLVLSLLLAIAPVALAQDPGRADPSGAALRQAIRAAGPRGQPVDLPNGRTADRLPAALQALDPNRVVSAYVVLEGESAAEAALKAGPPSAQPVADRLNQIRARQSALAPALAALGATPVYRYQRLANAIQVRVSRGRLAEIAALPGVARVDLVGRYRPRTTSSARLMREAAVWSPQTADATGEGLSIGIIDTGIDYTHADFGGSGIVGDYTGNDPAVIEAGTFPTAKVIGGYDFAGDRYNADSTDPAISTPTPDPDPLDCYGHGTHVAGIAAGFGVLKDGRMYTGPYDEELDPTQFEIGPGVAPMANLYALKIFGCTGSSELLAAAYEWAADPNGDGDFSDRLDVLNLSLGCDFSCGSATERGMTNLLAELGTFVAAAAGNAGNTFYTTGDPASASRAVSVAASVESGFASETLATRAAEQIAGFSSRGPSSPHSRLKPEIAAPGLAVNSAAMGTGTAGLLLSGTSMATPHIAGSAALLKEIHPGFTVEELKAVLMNTAVETRDPLGNRYPESRTGAGRVRVGVASQTQVTAVAEGAPGAVALSFGALNLSAPYTETQSVRLSNHGPTPVTYIVTVGETVGETGIRVVPLLSTVTVPAHGAVTVPVRFTADPAQFDMTSDPTTPMLQTGQARHSLYETSGQIRFHNPSQSIHLPYYASVYPASGLRADAATVRLPRGGSALASATIPITGTSAHPMPLVSAFLLGAESPDQHLDDPLMANADLLAVGAASDVASTDFFTETTVYFGIATAGQWTTPQPYLAEFNIYIDTNRDGQDDYVLFNWNMGSAAQGGTRAATDTFVTVLLNLSTNQAAIDSFLNIVPANMLETAPFNNSVAILPVSAAALGLTRKSGAFDYSVVSFGASGFADESSKATFDATNPVIDTAANGLSGLPLYVDGEALALTVDRAAFAATFTLDRPGRVLLLHHMNTPGTRLEVVTVRSNGFELFVPIFSANASD